MSFQIIDGKELFIPNQDYDDSSSEESENVNSNLNVKGRGKKRNKKSKRARSLASNKEDKLLDELVKKNESKRKQEPELIAKPVKLARLDFSSKAKGIQSYSQSLDKTEALCSTLKIYKRILQSEKPQSNEQHANIVVGLFYQFCISNGNDYVTRENVKEIYNGFLHQFVLDNTIDLARKIFSSGVLKKYPSDTNPMVLCLLQSGAKDIVPSNFFLMPLKSMIKLKIIPEKTQEFEIPGKVICYSLFWGIDHGNSSFGIVYETEEGEVGFYWITYNRKVMSLPALDKDVFCKGEKPMKADPA